MKRPSVGFLFLGELHLIPHLLPIAIALARRDDPPRITLYVATSVHEEILTDALQRLESTGIVIQRVRGFRAGALGLRETPSLPWKPLVLALNARLVLAEDVVVVAERTSLWLPLLVQRRGAAFVYNEHGAAPHANFASIRNSFATRLLMPSESMAARARAVGDHDVLVVVVGYMKPEYIRTLPTAHEMPRFPEARPTVVYVPHWKRDKSSWWIMGEAVLDWFAAQDRFNLIVAPHVRLPLFDAKFERRIAPYRGLKHIHVDATSFKLIDQTYIDHSDIYLGDGSSQVVEFARRPRPAVFLNAERRDWAADPRFNHWTLGDVVETVGDMERALIQAPERHASYRGVQTAYVEQMMGSDDGLAGARAADEVMALLAERRARKDA